jgi:hypothetical protein
MKLAHGARRKVKDPNLNAFTICRGPCTVHLTYIVTVTD